MAKQELTKKNEAFVFQLRKVLLAANKLSSTDVNNISSEVERELMKRQSTGQTAAQLYGTPSELAAKYLDPKRPTKQLHDYPRWVLSLDTMMVALIFVSVVFVATMAFNKTPEEQGLGIVSVACFSLVGLIYTLLIYYLVPNPKTNQRPGRLMSWLSIIATIVFGLGIFLFSALLPKTINPVLPTWGYGILAVVGFVILRWNRKKAGMENVGVFAVGRLVQQTRFNSQNQNAEDSK